MINFFGDELVCCFAGLLCVGSLNAGLGGAAVEAGLLLPPEKDVDLSARLTGELPFSNHAGLPLAKARPTLSSCL